LARTVGTTCRGKSFPVDAASHPRSAGADRALPPIYKPPVCTSLALSCCTPLQTYTSNTSTLYSPTLRRLHHCLRKEPLLTIGDLAFFGTWNLNKVRTDESEFRPLQVLC
jgi:hypothetical protein